MQSEHIGQLATALALAQTSLTLPKKNRTVKVKSDKGNYEFEYTTLDTMIEHVRDILTTNGLWFVQTTEVIEGGNILRTMLTHSSGEWIAGTMRIPSAARMQETGSALTYLRRYALAALLGIASEEDDDANTADGNSVETKKDKELPNPKTEATNWAKDAEARLKDFKTLEDFEAWHMAKTKTIYRLRDLNEAAHKRLTDAIRIRATELSTLNAG